MTRFRRILQTDAFLRIVLTFILTVFLAASGYHVRAANDRFSSADKKLGGYKSSKWSTNRYSHLPLFYYIYLSVFGEEIVARNYSGAVRSFTAVMTIMIGKLNNARNAIVVNGFVLFFAALMIVT